MSKKNNTKYHMSFANSHLALILGPNSPNSISIKNPDKMASCAAKYYLILFDHDLNDKVE